MIIGILSDPHGRGRMVARALRVLRAAGAEAFVLCGDVGGGGVLDELARAAASSSASAAPRAWFVWGNTDDPGPLLTAQAQSLGLNPPTEIPLRLKLAEHSLAVFHGHEPQFSQLVQLAHSGQTSRLEATLNGVQYVLFGHTHTACSERIGSVRFINPGALYRAHVHSVATLDLERDLVRFWRVSPDDAEPAGPLVELPWTKTPR